MYQDISIEDALKKMAEIPVVDLRSPGEFREATIPGALNIPLLDNVERAIVGTVHKHEGPGKARDVAMEILAPKLPAFVYSFKEIAPEKKVVIFCWRGGERSHFAASILDAMGFKIFRVTGGFKSYRKHVLQFFEREVLPYRAVVLHGLTGVGKTDVLLELQSQGFNVLDLEGLARHRGSVFGKIGQLPSPGQKMFEALIESELRLVKNNGFFLVECESKRIGKLIIPSSLFNTMSKGINILLYASVQARTERIKRDYSTGKDGNLAALEAAIKRLAKYIGNRKVVELIALLDNGKINKVIEFLLLNYYDPLYKYPDGPNNDYFLSVNTENLDMAVKEIACFMEGLSL
ncbi:tRNA 2-selenouridine(34) synthase MnmH [Desulfotruncus alcoholivorax]|uniref:tRNA 2-selenouridine(34) synthase MnmH n=1 Tax=Desulfotruncus alcoholivorax TaxID=265477 RepID=UPI000408B909|nr:tRNA 2-selenouridine(34) synthase MnmH [Desulfotruncus alcoholivorax]